MRVLNLCRWAIRDFQQPDFRMLFEDNEVTTYVWVSEQFRVTAFQVNYQEEYFFHFTPPATVKISGLSDAPLKRSINRVLTETETRAITGIVREIDNQTFAGLFARIRQAARGRPPADFTLEKKEIAAFRKMAKADYRAESGGA